VADFELAVFFEGPEEFDEFGGVHRKELGADGVADV
jgi:hypothetical protein